MIRARVRVDTEGGNFTTLVCAESLRKAELTTKTRYPESIVRIAFPLEPKSFFVGSTHTGGYAGLDGTEGPIGTTRPT
jgi:hypothetical protein